MLPLALLESPPHAARDVDGLGTAGVAEEPADSEPSVDAVAATGADETVCVPRLARGGAAPSSKIRLSFQSISCGVKKRLALSCKPPYGSSRPLCQEGLSNTISFSWSRRRCFSTIHHNRPCASSPAAESPRAVAAMMSDWQRPIWWSRPLR